MAHGGRVKRPPRLDTGLRVVGLLFVHLGLLHALFELLLGLFVLLFSLLHRLLHLLQGQLFLLLRLIVGVIGGEPADRTASGHR